MFFFLIFKIFTFWPHYAACKILVPWAGIWPTPPALEAWSLNHWTAWEGPSYSWITPLLAFPSTRPCEIIPISLTGCCKSSFLASYHFCGYPLSPLPALHCLRGQLLLWGARPGRGAWKDEICGSLITEVDGWFLWTFEKGLNKKDTSSIFRLWISWGSGWSGDELSSDKAIC